MGKTSLMVCLLTVKNKTTLQEHAVWLEALPSTF